MYIERLTHTLLFLMNLRILFAHLQRNGFNLGSVTPTQAKIHVRKLVEAVDRHGFEKAKKNYDMAMCKIWDYVDNDKLSNDSEQRPDRPSGSVIKTLN